MGRATSRTVFAWCLCLMVVLACPYAAAQKQDAAPAVVLEGRIEIPSKFSGGATVRLLDLGVEALGIEVQGRVELSSVTPPAGKLFVDSLTGDPQRIIAFISGWVAVPEGFSWRSDIESMTLDELVVSFGAERVSMSIARLSWSGGELGPIFYTGGGEAGEWVLSADRAFVKHPPLVFPDVPEMTDLQATGVRLQGRPEEITVRVDLFEFPGGTVEDFVVSLREPSEKVKTGAWSAHAPSARVDLVGLWPWISQWPQLVSWQQHFQQTRGWDSVQVQGELNLSSLHLDGARPAGEKGAWILENARAELRASDVGIIVQNRNDAAKKHWLKISEGRSKLRLQPELLEIGPVSLSVKDSGGGSLDLDGYLMWPPDLQRTRLEIAAQELSWAGYRVDGELGWNSGAQSAVDIKASAPDGLAASLQGRTQLWRPGDGPGADLILRQVSVALPGHSQSIETETKSRRKLLSDEPFLPSGAGQLPFPIRVQADRVEIAHWPVLSRFSVQSLSLGSDGEHGPEPVRLGFRGQWCEIDLSGEMAADQNGALGMQLEGRIRDVAFSNLVACSLIVSAQEAPPVYIEGRTTGRLLADVHGRTPAELDDSTTADLALTLREGRVMRLSNIDTGLGVILDILSAARLNPTQLRDTLPLDSLTLRLRRNGGAVEIRPIILRSPLLRVDGTLKTDLDTQQPALDIDMRIEAKGISKHLRKRINLEGEADAHDNTS